jgi:hypothetical protein
MARGLTAGAPVLLLGLILAAMPCRGADVSVGTGKFALQAEEVLMSEQPPLPPLRIGVRK